MSKLIALVAVAMLHNGVRTTTPPGGEVTGLSAVDEEALKRVGAIADQDEQAADKKAAAASEARAQREFAAARKLELAKSAAADLTLATS